MISRAVFARGVCLRCQLRILDRPRAHSSLRIAPFRTEFLQRRTYSSESAWERLTRTSEGKDEYPSTRQVPERDTSPSNEQPSQTSSTTVKQDGASIETEPTAPTLSGGPIKRSGPLLKRYYIGEDPLDRLSRRRVGNRSVYVHSEALGISILGEKGQAIVMRDMRGSNQNVKQLPIHEIIPDAFDISQSLEAEEKDLTMEEALSNLDEIRPWDPIVAYDDFYTLLDVLINGFTVAQLRAYLSRANARAAIAAKEKKKQQQLYDSVEVLTPWTPSASVEIDGSAKERLGLTLMLEAWRLTMREIVEGQGYLSGRIDERFFALLTNEEQRLDAIRESYLDPGESIDISDSIIKINATKAKTQAILQRLDEASKAIVVKTFKADWLADSNVDGKLLWNLGQLTNTFIDRKNRQEQIEVSWIKNGNTEVAIGEQVDQDDTGEQLGHIVQRLLHSALFPREQSIILKHEPNVKRARLVAEPRGNEKLSWKERLTQWSRWVKQGSRETSLDRTFTITEGEILPLPLTTKVQAADSDAPWSKPYVSTTASFGQILHKYDEGSFAIAKAAKTKNHIFSPASPPPAGLAPIVESVTSANPESAIITTLVLGFRPHPSVAKETTRSLPDFLELHLTVPDDLPDGPLAWDATPKRLVAILSQTFTDVAYPSEPVDLRLSQPLVSTMSPDALDSSAFREYIETAKLILLEGRLRPPPEVELSGLPSAEDDGSVSGPVKYMFAGLEMRRTLEVSYEGHKIQYASIEAGLHGGRRSQMNLEAVPARADAKLSKYEQKAYVRKYLDIAEDFVRGGVVQWIGERDITREFEQVEETTAAAVKEIEVEEAGEEQAFGESELDLAEEQLDAAEEEKAETSMDGEAETSVGDEAETPKKDDL
ncbi:mitochondrial inner-membrane-bound regulator-domain-containing protein [Colletotrichum phormii]|uniref:Mitochondrial inner-membrane-bound regulator-domain-containing protein n=1 Tax=Colletotrichum phormii TaxID=359342 RepID=A0AAJ0A7M3_9PEZI|nr:mitochondrial inner-membrane-bound regulator-domain-containing protein [Colletotrichum phormii]KAK1656035.1 mitochondrial inner-membrane-bound regulator-domain-containing protein [Colletotrichum phormii]